VWKEKSRRYNKDAHDAFVSFKDPIFNETGQNIRRGFFLSPTANDYGRPDSKVHFPCAIDWATFHRIPGRR
jgi:hypothetical protein